MAGEGWSQRVKFGGGTGSEFAYRPGEVLVMGVEGKAEAERLIKARLQRLLDAGVTPTGIPDGLAPRAAGSRPHGDERVFSWTDADSEESDPQFKYTRFAFSKEIQVLSLVDDLRERGFTAEPNYVLFAHNMSGNPLYGNPLYGNPLYGNPLYGNPLYGNPLYGNPLYGNPLYGNPLYGNPLYGNPLYGNPLYRSPAFFDPSVLPEYGDSTIGRYRATGRRRNTATPVADPKIQTFPRRSGVTVQILDSGLADTWKSKSAIPPRLKTDTQYSEEDLPATGVVANPPLDPIAGHGTFIAGLVWLLAPGTKLKVEKIFKIEGDVDEADLNDCLKDIPADDKTILNLSFGGYAPDDAAFLRRKIRNVIDKGIVVVASAGNDATSRPSFPASLPGVVGVGALAPYGPAAFTNYGPWVRACAPGVELVSTFFQNFDGPVDTGDPDDPDEFSGWARWSGTSFAAPIVCAALAREMVARTCDAREAVRRVIDSPLLFRIPQLGTVVNPPWPSKLTGSWSPWPTAGAYKENDGTFYADF